MSTASSDKVKSWYLYMVTAYANVKGNWVHENGTFVSFQDLEIGVVKPISEIFQLEKVHDNHQNQLLQLVTNLGTKVLGYRQYFLPYQVHRLSILPLSTDWCAITMHPIAKKSLAWNPDVWSSSIRLSIWFLLSANILATGYFDLWLIFLLYSSACLFVGEKGVPPWNHSSSVGGNIALHRCI